MAFKNWKWFVISGFVAVLIYFLLYFQQYMVFSYNTPDKSWITFPILIFVSGALIGNFINDWVDRKYNRFYLLTFVIILLSILLSALFAYSMSDCSLITKIGPGYSPPSAKCNFLITSLVLLWLSSIILLIASLSCWIYRKIKG